jgi:heme oxygenase (mycobilin-producing)
MSNVVHFEIEVAADATDADTIIRTTLAQTAAFDGNEGVRLLADESAPNRIVVEETWVDLDHYAAYQAWRATPEGASALRTILATPPSSRRFLPARVIDPA